MKAVCWRISVADWSAACRTGRFARELMDGPDGLGIKGADVALQPGQQAEQISTVGSTSAAHHRRDLFRVTVAFEPARLRHPIKQFAEILKIALSVTGFAWHQARLARRAARGNSALGTPPRELPFTPAANHDGGTKA
jgi:hypothetical protein